jgi:hypothetical protein
MNIYEKLNKVRVKFHSAEIKKTGINAFSKTQYFQLSDILVSGLQLFNEFNLSSFISFTETEATMTVINVDKPEEVIKITSPMAKAELKGMHPVQNLGATQTYIRRYLWTALLEVAEHDEVEMSSPLERINSFFEEWQDKIDEAVSKGWQDVITLKKQIPDSKEKSKWWKDNEKRFREATGQPVSGQTKSPISDERLARAIGMINNGERKLASLHAQFELTDAQKELIKDLK